MSSLSFRDIGLAPTVLRAVEEKAKRSGVTAPQYVRLLVERDLLADKSFDEILRPVRRDFRDKAVTEDELDQIVARARRSAPRKTRRARR